MTTLDFEVRYTRFYPGEAPLGATVKTVSLPADQTALLLVDVYHAAEKPEGKALVHSLYEQAWWEIVDDRLPPLIGAARAMGMPVIYAMNSAPRIDMPHSAFGRRLQESLGFNPELHFCEPTVDPLEYAHGELVQLAIPPSIAPRPEDYYIRKHTYSAFFETRLESLLTNLGVRTVICAGFVTNCCLFFSMGDALFRGFEMVLVRDCTLAAEMPGEVEGFPMTERMILWIESILAPSATAADVTRAMYDSHVAIRRGGEGAAQ
jgi:nicotinamidase-related amidase